MLQFLSYLCCSEKLGKRPSYCGLAYKDRIESHLLLLFALRDLTFIFLLGFAGSGLEGFADFGRLVEGQVSFCKDELFKEMRSEFISDIILQMLFLIEGVLLNF